MSDMTISGPIRYAAVPGALIFYRGSQEIVRIEFADAAAAKRLASEVLRAASEARL